MAKGLRGGVDPSRHGGRWNDFLFETTIIVTDEPNDMLDIWLISGQLCEWWLVGDEGMIAVARK